MKGQVKTILVINICVVAVNLLIHSIIQLRKDIDITITDSAYNLNETQILLQCKYIIRKPNAPDDFKEFTHNLRFFKLYYEEYRYIKEDHQKGSKHREIAQCFETLENKLFPYIKNVRFKRLDDLTSSYIPGSKGVVISACDYLFDYTVHLIRGLRSDGFDMPIMVVYIGDEDLRKDKQIFLNNMNVSTLDITQYVNDNILRLKGYAIKPFAILAAPYQEVMYLDADSLLLQNPTRMFHDEEYINTGILLQMDRALHEKKYSKQKLWLNDNLPTPYSEPFINSNIFRGYSAHQVDSSFLIINKKKRLFSLLAACKLNMWDERANYYEYFLGDKESFWLGAEMAVESYSFLPLLPGLFGSMQGEPDRLCGRQLMFDREGEPFYFNEAIVWDKREADHTKRVVIDLPEYYEYEGRWLKEIEELGGPRCLYSRGLKLKKHVLIKFQSLIDSYEYINITASNLIHEL